MDNATLENNYSNVTIHARRSIDVSGVSEIISYDDKSIVLVVCGDTMVIEGEQLHVTHLSVQEGKISATGKICALIYEEKTVKKGGIISGLFRG